MITAGRYRATIVRDGLWYGYSVTDTTTGAQLVTTYDVTCRTERDIRRAALDDVTRRHWRDVQGEQVQL